jgi:hypothetical protein
MKLIHPLLLLAIASLIHETAAKPKPTRFPSFGPNGTHWPGQVSGLVTPYMYDETVPHRIEVPCSWAAIMAAVNALTPTQVEQGAIILVRPGSLVGAGGSNSDPSDLIDIGDKTWTKRVTIAPRDGWGTLTVNGGFKMSRVENICIAGFRFNSGIRMSSCNRFAFARCLVASYIVAFGKSTEETHYRQWEFVELVKRQVNAPEDSDVMQLQALQSGGVDHVRDLVVDGSYFAPNYMNIGSIAHQDTIQHLSGGGWRFFGATYQDTAVFASNRCAINGGLDTVVLRNCWLNSRIDNQVWLYPVPAGAEMLSNAGVSQGSWKNATFDGGYVMGGLQSNTALSPNPYQTVLNGAKIDYQPTGAAAPLTGAWTVDTSLNGRTNPKAPPLPTDEYLDSIWLYGAVLPEVSGAPPPIGPPGPPSGLRVIE